MRKDKINFLDKCNAPKDLQTQIEGYLQKPLKLGDTWYFICKLWYEQFEANLRLNEKYEIKDSASSVTTCSKSNTPGLIDNALILNDSGDLKDGLLENSHFILVPEELWSLLVEWYGIVDNQKPVSKKVTMTGGLRPKLTVVTNLLDIVLWPDFNYKNSAELKLCVSDTIASLHLQVRAKLEIDDVLESRLWISRKPNFFSALVDEEKTCLEEDFVDDQVIVLETCKPQENWAHEYQSLMHLKVEGDTDIQMECFTSCVSKEERAQIAEYLKKPLKLGDTWYILCKKWFNKCKSYLKLDDGYNDEEEKHRKRFSFLDDNPGPIDNSLILNDAGDDLKEGMIEESDYVIVAEELWVLFLEFYGIMETHKPIPKKVSEFGAYQSCLKVEINLLKINFWQDFDSNKTVHLNLSVGDVLSEVHCQVREMLQIDSNSVSRLWACFVPNVFDPLHKEDQRILDVGLYENQVLVIEVAGADGQWIHDFKARTLLQPSMESRDSVPMRNISPVLGRQAVKHSVIQAPLPGPSSMMTRFRDNGFASYTPGICGLSNLGNTCFMNAVLQCMSNCPPLTDFFCNDHYRKELNETNPLGMKGEMAKAYAELIQIMWSGNFQYTVPHIFKLKVGTYAPTFSGYQQQDAQEFLTFFLDGLHEDLNRIKQKPYIVTPDADGRPDHVLAEEAWKIYRERNDSIIVDLFHGLLKSTVICPECKLVSVTFDPFCNLSLPLPTKQERHIEALVIFYNPEKKMMRYKCAVSAKGTIQSLAVELGGYCNIPPEQLLVTKVSHNHFHKIFDSNQLIDAIDEKDFIYVYEIPKAAANDPAAYAIIPVVMWELNEITVFGNNQLFGYPMVVAIPRNELTYTMLYDTILHKMSPFMNAPDDNSTWWNSRFTVTNGGFINEEPNHEENNEAIGDHQVIHPNGILDQHLFTLHLSDDAYGAGSERLQNDGSLIDIPVSVVGRKLCAVQWTSEAKSQFFIEPKFYEVDLCDTIRFRKPPPIHISECFEHYTVEEKLELNEEWYCPKCTKHQCATKKFDLWKLPKILVIHLKRFSYSHFRRDKLTTTIIAPLDDLDMANYVIGPVGQCSKYRLIGVCNHSGGMGGGHYTATARNKNNNVWYNFDDSHAVSVSSDYVLSDLAYVLFFMRHDVCCDEGSDGMETN